MLITILLILEILLTDFEINLILTWSMNCGISSNAAVNQATIFAITDTILSIPVLTLIISRGCKTITTVVIRLKRIIIWKKYESEASTQAQNKYLNYLLDPSFQGENRLLMLSFENNVHRIIHNWIYFFQLRE